MREDVERQEPPPAPRCRRTAGVSTSRPFAPGECCAMMKPRRGGLPRSWLPARYRGDIGLGSGRHRLPSRFAGCRPREASPVSRRSVAGLRRGLRLRSGWTEDSPRSRPWIRVLNASASMRLPPPECQMARRVFPPRLELKSFRGSFRGGAPGERQLDHFLVDLTPCRRSRRATTRERRGGSRGLNPFALPPRCPEPPRG